MLSQSLEYHIWPKFRNQLDRYKKKCLETRIGYFCKYNNTDDDFHFFFQWKKPV